MAAEKDIPQESKSPLAQSNIPYPKRKKSTAVVQVEATPDNMILIALQNGRTMDEIQALINMRNAELARVAELEFYEAKADFLKNCPAIVKNRTAPLDTTREGKKWGGYKYSDLDNLINTVKEAEGNAGLSHDWKDGRNEKGEVVVTCILSHSGGHKKESTITFGLDTGPGKNNIQAMKSTITYLRRATLESVLGVSQGGEDDDGATAERDEKGLEKLNDEQFNLVIKSIKGKKMTVEQVRANYSLSAGQENALEALTR